MWYLRASIVNIQTRTCTVHWGFEQEPSSCRKDRFPDSNDLKDSLPQVGHSIWQMQAQDEEREHDRKAGR